MKKAVWAWRRRSLGFWRSLAVWLLFAFLAWLDSDGCALALRHTVPIHGAAIFGAIASAIATIGGWLGTAAAASAAYLASAVSWIAGRLLTFIKATGAVFAKAWDAMKIVYADVLKPALKWIDAHVRRLYGWLRNTLKPVFEYLRKVNDALLKIYKKYVRPVLDIIDYTRIGLRVLGDLGVEWARALDRRLGEYESLITENFRRILSYVNEAIDIVNAVVTKDKLFQSLPFLRSLDRDARYWFAIWWRRQVDPDRQHGDDYDRTRDYPLAEPFENGKRLALFYRGQPTDVDGQVAELVAWWRDGANWDGPDLLTRRPAYELELSGEGP